MKHISSENANIFENGLFFIANEYETNDKDINIAKSQINGRYPEEGRIANTICKEIVYVANGKGSVFIEDKEIKLNKDDVVLIEPNEKYYWEGSLTLIPACYPAWTPKQVKHFDC